MRYVFMVSLTHGIVQLQFSVGVVKGVSADHPQKQKTLSTSTVAMRQVSVYVFVCDTYSVRLFPFLLRETW